MQTFLPYPDFMQSAKCLDYRRLGKQRVEAFQILQTLTGKSLSWGNHPAVKMWEGHTASLKYYYNCFVFEWVSRGYNNTMQLYELGASIEKIPSPDWIGQEDFHSAHRSALLFKNFEYYSKFNWTEEPKIDYIWPRNDLVEIEELTESGDWDTLLEKLL